MNEYIDLAERSVIGACMLSPEWALAKAADALSPKHFDSRALGTIYETMLKMQGDGEKIDFVTLLPQLTAQGIPEGTAKGVLVACMDECPTTQNIISHIGVIRKGYRARRAIGIANELLLEIDDDDALTRAADELSELLTDGADKKLESAIDIAAREYMPLLDKARLKSKMDIGYSNVDAIIDGIYPGEVFVIGGRPAAGKTALAMFIAANTAAKGKTVAIYSLEMSTQTLFWRYTSGFSGVSMHKIKNADLDAVAGDVAKGCDRFAKLPLQITDRAQTTIADIRNECRFTKNLGLVMIDYLQLIQPRMGQKYQNRTEMVGQISRDLKILAKELNVPVLVLSQLNRTGGETREPTVAEMRESGSIEQDADIILLLWQHESREDLVCCKVAKNRNGGTGKACLLFDRARMRFEPTAEMPPEPKRGGAWAD